MLNYLSTLQSDDKTSSHFLALVEYGIEGAITDDNVPSLILDCVAVKSLLEPLDSFLSGRGFGWGDFSLETVLVTGDGKEVAKRFQEFEDKEDRHWWIVSLSSRNGEGVPVTIYDDILALEGIQRELKSIHRVPKDLQEILEKFALTEGIKDASEEVIRLIFDRVRIEDDASVAVYDVGQGNCNAIVNSYSMPVVYYDFGRPLSFNNKTAPSPWPKFCFTERPPIILSHWDFDHWAGAKLGKGRWHSDATNTPWIAPRQYLSPNHLKFVIELIKNSSLFYWPAALNSMSTSFGEIVRCSGPNNGLKEERNNSGLALFATTANHHQNGLMMSVLLPGDAEFQYITSRNTYSLVGLVASHHGAKISFAPPAANGGKLALSVGSGNCYGHPQPQALSHYSAAGWQNQVSTSNRIACPSGHISSSGNIHLPLGAAKKLPLSPPCGGGGCSLFLVN